RTSPIAERMFIRGHHIAAGPGRCRGGQRGAAGQGRSHYSYCETPLHNHEALRLLSGIRKLRLFQPFPYSAATEYSSEAAAINLHGSFPVHSGGETWLIRRSDTALASKARGLASSICPS